MAELSTPPKMTTAPIDADTFFKWFACRCPALITAMVVIDRTGHPRPGPAVAPLASRPSSLGLLDRLPTEILFLVLGMLDTQSVPHVACASFKGAMLVRSHPEYQNLRHYAPQALAALAMTETANLHSVRWLHMALRSERCVLCPGFGFFLFLPTGERCCDECLRSSPYCEMIDIEDARRGFLLSNSQLKQLAILHVPPRTFWVQRKANRGKLRIVRKQAARELALTLWPRAWRESEGPPPHQVHPNDVVTPVNSFYEMASIELPSVSKDGAVEEGFWCSACRLFASTWPARPKALFMEHVQACSHARGQANRFPSETTRDRKINAHTKWEEGLKQRVRKFGRQPEWPEWI